MIEVFKASTHYADWSGDVQSDNADMSGIHSWMEGKGLIGADEALVGIEFYSGERGFLLIDALIAPATGYDAVKGYIDTKREIGPIPLRKVSMELDLGEFFGLFKRFSIVLSPKGILRLGDEYTDSK